MRAVATFVAWTLLAPPVTEPEDIDSSSEEQTPTEQDSDHQQSLDCLVDGCDSDQPDAAIDNTLAGEDLKLEGRGLIASGEYEEGIALLEQAYHLTPGDHILAYEIASAAQKLGHCTTMRRYLAHFVQYADPEQFRNKIAKASRALQSSTCLSTANSEALEAAVAGGYGTSSVAAANDGSGLVAGGVIMAGAGVISVVAGIALVAIGLTGTNSAVNRLEAPAIALRNYLIIGGITGPAGVALIAGGSVMVARGKSMSHITMSPTGLTIRF